MTEDSQHLSSWIKRATILAWVTIAYNIVEGAVSIAFSVAVESVALFGFGADSLIEVASAIVILWRFRGEHGGIQFSESKERRATATIGALFLLLAALTIIVSSFQLVTRSHPESTLAGIIISAVSLSSMFFLWSLKKQAGRKLRSAAVLSDAACTFACIKLSIVLFFGSILFWMVPSLWWADGAAALVLSAFIAREGWGMWRGECHNCAC